jgi:cephalosporin-C deacetylase-like acetyl esterase
MWLRFGATLALGLAASTISVAQQEDLSVVARYIAWTDAPNWLQKRLNAIAFSQLAARRERIGKLGTVEDWKTRRKEVREALAKVVGPFPERTPLNPRVLGTVKKESYRIEKVVFESQPKFFVTACLFIPNQLNGRTPAILNVIGHTGIAFRAPSYQQLLLNLVRKGFIVLAMDPIGQGERLQYYDPALKRSSVGGSTDEHSYLANQCFLAESSAARYFTWDGIRAIDYLVSRPEVDPARIGVTGLSGGGTQTAYIAALDDRVAAAAPANYICGFERLFASIGPQDGEQHFNRGIVSGLDHADLLEVRAPKPTLIVATTRDFFSIQGAREVFAETLKAFEALGDRENLVLAEDDYEHGYTVRTREAIYRFFQKHLALPGQAADEKVWMLGLEELTVTKTGQVSDSLGGETVFSLNRAHAQRLLERLERSRAELATHLPKVKTAARDLSGYLAPREASGLIFRGQYQRDGYSIEKWAMAGEGEYIVPFLLMIPAGVSNAPGVVYLHPGGKSAAAGRGGEIEWFVRQGYAVLAPDLPGVGEIGPATAPTGRRSLTAFLGAQTGRSVVGIRAGDIARCVRYLESRTGIDGRRIAAVARGPMTIPLLHAAAFNDSIGKIALIEPLVSFESVVINRFYNTDFSDTVANALTGYDLPDLAAALAPRPLLVVGPQDQMGVAAAKEQVEREFRVVRAAYAHSGAAASFSTIRWEAFQGPDEVLGEWLRSDPKPLRPKETHERN